MAIRFGATFRTFERIKIRTEPSAPPKAAMTWSKPTGNIGTFPSGSHFLYWLGAVDPENAIERYEIINGAIPYGISLNPFSGELEGNLPDDPSTQTYTFTVRVTTEDRRTLVGTFSFTVEYIELVVNWITPSGSLGTYDIGGPVHAPLEAKANK